MKRSFTIGMGCDETAGTTKGVRADTKAGATLVKRSFTIGMGCDETAGTTKGVRADTERRNVNVAGTAGEELGFD